MKKYLSIALLLAFSFPLLAQTGHEYLNRLPVIPRNPCSMDAEKMNEMLKEVRDIIKQLNARILEMKKETKEDYNAQKDRIEREMASQYGLSNSDVQKLKQKNLSKEEKKAIADKMLQEKTGISMDEIAKLKSMSKEGKKQWAKGYAEQQQANLSAGPGGQKSPEQIEMEKRLIKDKGTLDLAKEQKSIADRIAASDKKFAGMMKEFMKDDSVALKVLKTQLKPLEDRLSALPGPSEDEILNIKRQKRDYYRNYCSKISPKYNDMCKFALQSLTSIMPDYNRLEEINDKLNSQTIGLRPTTASKGLMQLEAVKAYASLLLNAFNYGAFESAAKIE